MTAQPQRPAFGTLLTSHMAVATYQGGRWSPSEIKPVAPIELTKDMQCPILGLFGIEDTRPSPADAPAAFRA